MNPTDRNKTELLELQLTSNKNAWQLYIFSALKTLKDSWTKFSRLQYSTHTYTSVSVLLFS